MSGQDATGAAPYLKATWGPQGRVWLPEKIGSAECQLPLLPEESMCLPSAFQISFHVLLVESRSPPEAWRQESLRASDPSLGSLLQESIGGGGNGLWVTASSVASCWRYQLTLTRGVLVLFFFFLKTFSWCEHWKINQGKMPVLHTRRHVREWNTISHFK